MQYQEVAAIPMKSVGPVKLIGEQVNDEVMVPLATFESPVWPSTNRGAKATRLSGGIKTTVMADHMTRSVLFEAPDATVAKRIIDDIETRKEELSKVVSNQSRFATLKDWHVQYVGNLIYFRIAITSGDASGHNMVTAAAEHVMNWLLLQYPALDYVSISGNFCTDKKATAVNGILGRGKYVIAEVTIPREVCLSCLKTTPEKIVNLNLKKNLLGTLVAGGLRSANAHFANILLAFYLATGQDAANIIEGSQGIVHTEVKGEDLYFSITLPNVIVGSIGAGKDLEFTKTNLTQLGCLAERPAGDNAKRLACLITATVLCGELSLLAAQTNPGELMQTHFRFERATEAKKTPA